MGYTLCLAHGFISHRLARALKAWSYGGRGSRRNRSAFVQRIIRLHRPYDMVAKQAQSINKKSGHSMENKGLTKIEGLLQCDGSKKIIRMVF